MAGFPDIPLHDLAAGDEEDGADDVAEETSFIDPADDADIVHEAGGGGVIGAQHREILRDAVDGYYNALAEKGQLPVLERDTSRFFLDRGQLRLKNFPRVDIISDRGRPLALSTISGKRGGTSAIRDGLGFMNWSAKRKLPTVPKARRELLKIYDEAAAADLVGTADIDKQVDDLIDDISAMDDKLIADISAMDDLIANIPAINDGVDTVDTAAQTTQTLPPDLLPLRELLGLNEGLKNVRATKASQESKVVSLQQTIEGYREDLKRPGTTERADQIERDIQNAEDELAAAQDSVDALNQQLRSQVRQIRESISNVLDKDKPLVERIRNLFREQGITITSILVAIGMTISTVVLAITGGGAAPTPAPTPTPPSGGGAREWVKKHLRALGRMLAQLAGKAAAALPDIIGSIISWLLNLLSKTAGWLAENLWALVVAVGGLLLVFAQEWLA